MIEKDDIINRDFGKSLFGYDRVEVEYFQKMIAREFDKLKEKIDELEEVKDKYKQIQGKKADEIVEEGRDKADEIVSKARKKSDIIIENMEEKKSRLKDSINKLELKKASLINSINDILKSQKELVELYYNDDG
ncbi:MAG: DivIVA domain-containing protein [Candidatus Marinimicrobia bacterium]|nr:DivIVA domain-containing protein [Candidatus Neomarinimicrobiota bacterium]